MNLNHLLRKIIFPLSQSQRSSSDRGYTLIEILVAAGIFFVVLAGPTGLLISSLRSQTRILGLREIIDNSSHVLEYMSRALRMAKKELNCDIKYDPTTCFCLKSNGYGFNYEKTDSRILAGTVYSGPGIKFNNYQEPPVCQEFFWDMNDNRFKESKNGSVPIPLTSDDLEITLLEFESFGEGQADDSQPRVTVFFDITKKGALDFPHTRIQTTISQRNLDVMY
ncbi:MAG: PilW family protein [Candidatus Nealsonbacteria bacterium]